MKATPQPLVSVVIPAYNVERFVSDAIKSAHRQTYRPIEIVVVDDGSTDNTADRIKSFGDAVCYLHQANAGLSAARNRGIRESNGEFVAFLDADDQWHPSKLTRQIELLQTNPQIGVVHTDVNYLHDPPGIVQPAPAAREEFQNECLRQLWHGNRISVSSVVVQRSLLEQVGCFDERITRPTTQDYDLWLSLARHTMFGFIAEALTTCRMHSSNAGKRQVDMKEDVVYVLEKAITEYPEIEQLVGMLNARRRVGYVHLELAHLYIQYGNMAKARNAIRKHLRYSPKDVRSWVLFLRTYLRTASQMATEPLRNSARVSS